MELFSKNTLLDSLIRIFKHLNVRNLLLITGKYSFDNSYLNSFFNELSQEVNVVRYQVKGSKPDFKEIIDGITGFDLESADLIVSVGGGSVIDFTKLVKYYVMMKGEFDLTKTSNTTPGKTIPLSVIPTTSGSGSEATHFAVLYKQNIKYSISHPDLLPEYVFLEPSLTVSLSAYQTACSGLDALCQALESIWAKAGTETSREYAFAALQHIVPNLRKAVLNPDIHSRSEMMIGSNLAGKAINISKTTAPHALSYYLTAYHDIPHGEAVGMNIGIFVKVNWKYLSSDIQERILRVFDVESSEKLAEYLLELRKTCGLKTDFSEIKGLDIKQYVSSVNAERMNNNPCVLSPEEMAYLFTSEYTI